MLHRRWEFGGVWIHLGVCVCQFGTDNEDLVGTKRHIRVTALALRAHSHRHQKHARQRLAEATQPGPGEGFLAGWLPHRLTGWVAACLGINWTGCTMCKNITHTLLVKQCQLTVWEGGGGWQQSGGRRWCVVAWIMWGSWAWAGLSVGAAPPPPPVPLVTVALIMLHSPHAHSIPWKMLTRTILTVYRCCAWICMAEP